MYDIVTNSIYHKSTTKGDSGDYGSRKSHDVSSICKMCKIRRRKIT